MRKHLLLAVALTPLVAWNVWLQAQVLDLAASAQDVAFERQLSAAPDQPDPIQPSPDPVEMSEPYDPIWDADTTDHRSAYQRGRDVKVLSARLQAPVADWVRTRDEGCRLARMGVSEDTRPLRRRAGGGTEGELTADHHGIAAVVKNNMGRLSLKRHRLKGKAKTWVQVMGELSPHVNRVVELKPGKPRQVWTSSLPCAGDEMPEGWEDDPQAGDWEIARQFWPTFRDEVVRLWLTDDFDHVPGKPIGWGSMTGDIPKALARGMVLVPWGDGRNGFVRWPTADERRLVVATGPKVP